MRILCLAVVLAVPAARAQSLDPLVADPQHYRLEVENHGISLPHLPVGGPAPYIEGALAGGIVSDYLPERTVFLERTVVDLPQEVVFALSGTGVLLGVLVAERDHLCRVFQVPYLVFPLGLPHREEGLGEAG